MRHSVREPGLLPGRQSCTCAPNTPDGQRTPDTAADSPARDERAELPCHGRVLGDGTYLAELRPARKSDGPPVTVGGQNAGRGAAGRAQPGHDIARIGDRVRELLPAARVAILAGASHHSVPANDYAQLNRELAAFLG